MAARRKAPERIETREQAYFAAHLLSAEANGVRCVAKILSLDDGGLLDALNQESADWLRNILHDWIVETATRIEKQGDRIEAFLKTEQPQAAVA